MRKAREKKNAAVNFSNHAHSDGKTKASIYYNIIILAVTLLVMSIPLPIVKTRNDETIVAPSLSCCQYYQAAAAAYDLL